MEKLDLNNLCDICGKRVNKIFKCAKCRKIKYCNKDCQIKDWVTGHREECEQLKKSIVPTMKYVNRLMDSRLVNSLLAAFGSALAEKNNYGYLSLSISVVENYNVNVSLKTSLIIFNAVVFPTYTSNDKPNCKPVLVKYIAQKDHEDNIHLICIDNTVHKMMFCGIKGENFEETKNKCITKLNNTIFKKSKYKFEDFQNSRICVAIKSGNFRIGLNSKLGKLLSLNKGEITSLDKISIPKFDK